MNYSFTKEGVRIFALSIMMQILLCYFYISAPEGKEISVLCVSSCVLFALKFRKSIPVFFLFTFFSLYCYAGIEFFFNGIRVSGFRSFTDKASINHVLFINSLFITTIGNVISSRTTQKPLILDDSSYKSAYMFWFLVFVGIVMIQFGIQGENMLVSGGYGQGEVSKSSLHEYFILTFFIILLVKPKNNVLTTIVIYTLYFIYCLKTLLYGGRIEVMQISLLLFSYYFIFPHKVNKTLLFSFVGVAYYFSSVVSRIRNNPIEFLRGNYMPYLNLFYKPPRAIELPQEYLGNNQGDVLQSSARMLGLIQDGYLDISTRIASFFTMLLSIAFPSDKMPPYTNLASYHQTGKYISGGGGLISMYFYVYMSYLGPLFIGIFVGYFINQAFKSKKIGLKVYGVMLLIMFPRWYAYGTIIIFKMCFLTVVVYHVVKLFHSNVFKKKAYL